VTSGQPRIRLAHLFPAQLNLYGDIGNIAALTQRARWRGIDVDVVSVSPSDQHLPPDTNIIFIGGGPDRAQSAIADALNGLAPGIRDRIDTGAALLAVCGGYQNLGSFYRSEHAGVVPGAGLFGAWTEAPKGGQRLSTGCIVSLAADSPIAAAGRDSAARAGLSGQELSVVGYENHSGRTYLEEGATSLGRVVAGSGNNGQDGMEGFMALPGPGGSPGLRLGTYLHGPLLPRNPHLADYILLCALSGQGVTKLSPLDDRDEWAAHDAFARRWLREG
jgi:CobQ-like glutamine amidotransferase family enzyme